MLGPGPTTLPLWGIPPAAVPVSGPGPSTDCLSSAQRPGVSRACWRPFRLPPGHTQTTVSPRGWKQCYRSCKAGNICG